MKKVVFILLLAGLVATGAFAQQGWGVGAFGTFGGSFTEGSVGSGGALSLKAPTLPMYWGISFSAGSNHMNLGLSADYPIINGVLVSDVGLGWYVQGGLYGKFATGTNYTALGAGARLPIGLNLRLPSIRFLEFFLSAVPNVGIYTGNFSGNNSMDIRFDSGWAGEIGFRVWLSYL